MKEICTKMLREKFFKGVKKKMREIYTEDFRGKVESFVDRADFEGL